MTVVFMLPAIGNNTARRAARQVTFQCVRFLRIYPAIMSRQFMVVPSGVSLYVAALPLLGLGEELPCAAMTSGVGAHRRGHHRPGKASQPVSRLWGRKKSLDIQRVSAIATVRRA